MPPTPPLLRSYAASSDASEPVELAYTPTWPTKLQSSVSYIKDQSPQPDLYLHLSQVLEWEIWTHSQTRAKLSSECMRSAELAGQVNRLSSELLQLQKSCQSLQQGEKESSFVPQCRLKQERKVWVVSQLDH